VTSTAESRVTEVPDEERPEPPEVREALRKILASHPFHTSKQCQDLLRYVVERTLNGADGSLRERIIGVEVFGRAPAYDTSEDPVVRVRAADVRKRLAQYYQSLEPGAAHVHIELQPGSYRAHVRLQKALPRRDIPAVAPPVEVNQPEEGPLPAREPEMPRPGGWLRMSSRLVNHSWWGGALALILISSAIGASSGEIQSAFRSPQKRFWDPVLSAREPVVLYLGANSAYILSADYLAQYRGAHGIPNNGPEFFPDFAPAESIRPSDLVPVRDTFVTVGDLAATVQLTNLLTAWKRPFVLRSGRDINFAELRNRPSVMIGAFNNPWTLELTRDLPFSLENGIRIQDRDHRERSWTVTTPATHSTSDDFALISCLLVSKTGGPLISAAGIGQYGTQAAAEFLSSPDRMRDLLRTAPRGWEHKNMQAVLHVKVVGYTPVAVDVLATSYW
jgi:hypothetical protein